MSSLFVDAEAYCPHNGVADDAPGITAAMTAAFPNKVVTLPGSAVPYMIGSSLNVSARSLCGVVTGNALLPTGYCTVLRAMPSCIGPMLKTVSNGTSVCNMVLDAAGTASHGMHVMQGNGRTLELRNVTALSALVAGFWFDRCQAAIVERLLARLNPVGFQIDAGNHMVLLMCSASGNTSHGFVVAKSTSQPSAGSYAHLVECLTELNGGDGIHIEGTAAVNGSYIQGAQVRSCHVEANGGHGIYARYVTHMKLTDNRIVPPANPDANERGIYLDSCKNCDVGGNMVAYPGTQPNWYKIKNLADPAGTNEFRRNLQLSDIANAVTLPVETT